MRSAKRTLAALITMLVLEGCSRHFHYRYKLEFAVQTPDGIKSGSSVLTTDINMTQSIDEGQMAIGGVVGDAVPINLGKGNYIFALLIAPEKHSSGVIQGHEDYSKALAPSGSVFWNNQTRGKAYQAISVSERTASLVGKKIPYFAIFENLNDPNSVRMFDADQIPSEIGSGYYFSSATIRITHDKYTDTLSKILPWIRNCATYVGLSSDDLYGLRSRHYPDDDDCYPND